jgi:alpha-L-rhamnosidase
MKVSVPVNTTATLYIPSKPGSEIFESGQPLNSVKGLKYVREGGGNSIIEAGSGNYVFESVLY